MEEAPAFRRARCRIWYAKAGPSMTMRPFSCSCDANGFSLTARPLIPMARKGCRPEQMVVHVNMLSILLGCQAELAEASYRTADPLIAMGEVYVSIR